MLDRGSAFSDPDVVELLKTRFVPAAIDQAYQRRQKDAEGRFYQKIANQGPRKAGDGGPTTQGRYVATADGRFLGYNNHRDPQRLLGMMRRASENPRPKRSRSRPSTPENRTRAGFTNRRPADWWCG